MFGGPFGSRQSRARHFFNEQHPVYQAVAGIAELLKRRIELRLGRQYLRQISGNGEDFGYPHLLGGQMRSLVPWSRLFDNRELLLAINTDPDNALTAWVTIDDSLHRAGDRLTCIYATDAALVGRTVDIEARNGKAVRITVPAAGFVVYEKRLHQPAGSLDDLLFTSWPTWCATARCWPRPSRRTLFLALQPFRRSYESAPKRRCWRCRTEAAGGGVVARIGEG